MNAPALESTQLERGLEAAQLELQQAREAYARAAYDHALDRDNPKTREALIKAQQHRDVLQAEIDGLDAATGEARRREAIAAEQAAHDERMAMFDDALKAIEQMRPALRDAVKAAATLGEKRRTLDELSDRVLMQFQTATEVMPRRPEVKPLYSDTLEHLWRQLLQHHGVVDWSTFEVRIDDAARAEGVVLDALDQARTLTERFRDTVATQHAP